MQGGSNKKDMNENRNSHSTKIYSEVWFQKVTLKLTSVNTRQSMTTQLTWKPTTKCWVAVNTHIDDSLFGLSHVWDDAIRDHQQHKVLRAIGHFCSTSNTKHTKVSQMLCFFSSFTPLVVQCLAVMFHIKYDSTSYFLNLTIFHFISYFSFQLNCMFEIAYFLLTIHGLIVSSSPLKLAFWLQVTFWSLSIKILGQFKGAVETIIFIIIRIILLIIHKVKNNPMICQLPFTPTLWPGWDAPIKF